MTQPSESSRLADEPLATRLETEQAHRVEIAEGWQRRAMAMAEEERLLAAHNLKLLLEHGPSISKAARGR